MTEDEQKELLNKIDQGYVGITKPVVVRKRQDFVLPSMFDGSDNMPNDPEQNWDEDIHT